MGLLNFRGNMTRRTREMEVLLKLARETGEPSDIGDRLDRVAPSREPKFHAIAASPLLRDLSARFETLGADLLNPEAILGVSSGEFDFMKNRSLRDVILDPGLNPACHRRLESLGALVSGERFSPRLRVLGRVLRFLANAALLVHHGAPLPVLTPEFFRRNIDLLKRAKALDPEIMDMCKEVGEILFMIRMPTLPGEAADRKDP